MPLGETLKQDLNIGTPTMESIATYHDFFNSKLEFKVFFSELITPNYAPECLYPGSELRRYLPHDLHCYCPKMEAKEV
jgi:hypothetical protein